MVVLLKADENKMITKIMIQSLCPAGQILSHLVCHRQLKLEMWHTNQII